MNKELLDKGLEQISSGLENITNTRILNPTEMTRLHEICFALDKINQSLAKRF
jgi:hypothetical protein